MKLIGNTVLLRPLSPASQSAGGIDLAPKFQDDCKQWIVVAVGDGRRLKDGTRLSPEVRVGDKCLYDQNTLGTRHSFDYGWILVDARKIQMIWG